MGSSQIHGYMDTWPVGGIHGYMDTSQYPGYMDTWIHGYIASSRDTAQIVASVVCAMVLGAWHESFQSARSEKRCNVLDAMSMTSFHKRRLKRAECGRGFPGSR
jgi:hypothetical protein